ncbi:VWA domain-containing protein [Bermanella marisrubri]|nr:VWA domain-containing protein [Bermanella marisrubri]
MITLLFLSACTQQAPTTGLYLLLDTSGTYTKELKKAQQIIHYYLAELNPGDSFAVGRIDSASFSEKDIIAKVTFDLRPSKANEQKRQFAQQIADFIDEVESSAYTDITGGMLMATEYLNEVGSAQKNILIFSDLQEDLPKGYSRDVNLSLNDFNVIALNVTKLRSDNQDPQQYMNRMSNWQNRIEDAGGQWRIINDLERQAALSLQQ